MHGIGGSPSKTIPGVPLGGEWRIDRATQGGIAMLRELMDLALARPLRGSINHVLAGDLVAPATQGQVTDILAMVLE